MWICGGVFICDGFKWNICGFVMVLDLDLYYLFMFNLCFDICICGFMKLLYANLGVELLIVKLWLDFIWIS